MATIGVVFGFVSGFRQWLLAHPSAGLWGALSLSLLSVWLGLGVELRTSRSELAPAGDPDQARWERLLGEYKASQLVIACVESSGSSATQAEEIEAFTDRLAASFAADPRVASVFHRLDTDWIDAHAVHMLPVGARRTIESALGSDYEFVGRMLEQAGFTGWNRMLRERIEGSHATVERLDGASQSAEILARYFELQRQFLEAPDATSRAWTSASAWVLFGGERRARLGRGYLASHDGEARFIVITPAESDDSLPVLRSLMSALRGRAADATAEAPDFRVAFTGTPAMTVEEMASIRADSWRSSAIALVAVTLLTLTAFRWKMHALLVLAALAMGVLWSFGAVRLELGYLNLITSAFISTLIGVGVAYGIHPVSEYELEGAHTLDPDRAVARAFGRTDRAVGFAGLTTAVAFFSILLMQFRGFAELGLVAGVGVLLCLVAALCALPSMLLIYGRRRRRRDAGMPARSASGLDRLWLDGLAGRITARPRLVVVIASLLTVAAAVLVSGGIAFNSNILDLLPRDAEALRYQRRVTLDSDLSPVFNFVVADGLDALRAMQERAEKEPTIARFESALPFLADPTAAQQLVVWAERIEALPAVAGSPLSRAELRDSLTAVESSLADAADDAFAAGQGELAATLDRARTEADRARRIVQDAGQEMPAAWEEGERRLRRWLDETRAAATRSLRTEAPRAGRLPEWLQRRYFTDSGQPLGFLYPAVDVFDPDQLERYIAASLRVSETSIGFPFMFHKMSQRITSGFYRAVSAGAALVFVILLLDFRRLRHALLAALPLGIGMLWTLGLMRLLGISFNFANIVAVPLIVGVGIDNGVHILHRMRSEGMASIESVLRHAGRAILISSLTTMAGFGSLALASHRGMASLGTMLFIGVGACLLASLIVLPNLMVLLHGRPRR